MHWTRKLIHMLFERTGVVIKGEKTMDSEKAQLADEILGISKYHIPKFCTECGGVMIFKGVGEYRCEECNRLEYDDYGKVRLFLERNRGATAVEIENATGVKQKTIRLMLKESRLEVVEGSKTFLLCEHCNKKIRYGRLCPQCEKKFHKNMEEKQRNLHNADLRILGLGNGPGEEGERRFKRQ